jgi:hypothetical protein
MDNVSHETIWDYVVATLFGIWYGLMFAYGWSI